jgi:hypothetical protein
MYSLILDDASLVNRTKMYSLKTNRKCQKLYVIQKATGKDKQNKG